jgi:hypothetical protein
MRTLTCNLALSGLIGMMGMAGPWGLASAGDRSIMALPDGELERSYWDCDWQARLSADAGERFDDGLMQFCGGVSHELQVRKFDGDFGKLHRWTETHRTSVPRKHEGLRQAPPVTSPPARFI